MKKLILHIGNHKTATTSIQKFLKDNKAELNNINHHLVDSDPTGEINSYGHNNHWITHSGYGDGFQGKMDLNWLNDIKKIDAETIIFSAEHLSWIFKKDEILRIHKKLIGYFDEIKIIAYIRRQDKQLLSHHQQGSKHLDWCEQRYFGSDPRAFPHKKHFNSYLDYYSRFSMWGEAFGYENITIRPFEPDQLFEKNVISDFLHFTSIKIKPTDIRINESNDYAQTIAGHIYNQIGISHLDQKRISVLHNISLNEKLLGNRSEAIYIYEYYKLSNKYLNEKFKISKKEFIFDESFTNYPEEEDYQEKYIEIIKKLLILIDNKMAFINDKDFFKARDILIKIKEKEPEAASELAVFFSKLRKNPIKLKEILENK